MRAGQKPTRVHTSYTGHLNSNANIRLGHGQTSANRTKPGPSFQLYQVKLPNLKLKTQPKQLRGFLPLVIALPPQLKMYLQVGQIF